MLYEITLIIGAALLATGVGAYLHPSFFHKLISNFAENPATVYLSGLLSLTVGILIVLNHNIWVKDWPVLITIIGWSSLLKGVWLMVNTQSYIKTMKSVWKTNHVRGEAVFMMIVGAMLVYISMR